MDHKTIKKHWYNHRETLILKLFLDCTRFDSLTGAGEKYLRFKQKLCFLSQNRVQGWGVKLISVY